MSWTNISDATDPSWTGESTTTRPGWRQLSAKTDGSGGIDFVLRADDQFPMYVLPDDDPRILRAWDSPFTQGV